MTDSNSVEWQSYCTNAQFEQLRGDPRFQRLVTLSRIVNSIRFIETAVIDRDDLLSPAGARQRASAYLYLAAVLHEGLKFADRLGEHFREWPDFQDGLARVLSRADFKALRSTVLDKLRDKAVYHHDDDTVEVGLSSMAADEYVFFSGRGPTRGEAYYDLADLVVFQYALGLPSDPEELRRRLKLLLDDLIALALAFADAADRLIAAGLRSFRLPVREGSLE
jgi:hypothetical protein